MSNTIQRTPRNAVYSAASQLPLTKNSAPRPNGLRCLIWNPSMPPIRRHCRRSTFRPVMKKPSMLKRSQSDSLKITKPFSKPFRRILRVKSETNDGHTIMRCSFSTVVCSSTSFSANVGLVRTPSFSGHFGKTTNGQTNRLIRLSTAGSTSYSLRHSTTSFTADTATFPTKSAQHWR